MIDQKIFSHTLVLQMAEDATPAMREWFANNRVALFAGIRERVEPELLKLLKMEINQLGFAKAFPLEKEL